MDIDKKILNELPVKEIYADLLKPSMSCLGKTGEDILKFASLPFSFLGMTAEELENRYKIFITSALNKVPEKKREKPSALIAGPLFEHIKYMFDEDEQVLENMFSELLGNACNKDMKCYVMPSYVYTLKQITCAEAKILKLIYEFQLDGECLGVAFKRFCKTDKKVIHVFSQHAEPLMECWEDDRYSNVFFEYYIPVAEDKIGLSSEEFHKSLNILEQLALIHTFSINKYKEKDKYSLEEHNKEHAEIFDPYKRIIGYSLTSYANDMMELCISAKDNEEEKLIYC